MVTAERKPQKEGVDVDRMMKVYQELGTPGEPHRNLERMAGKWDVKTRAWPAPGMPAVESVGTSEHVMILDGRYLQQKQTGSMGDSPYHGLGYTAYDNNTRRYVTTWMDSLSTAIMYIEGTAGGDGSTIVQESLYDDPVLGPVQYHAETKIESGDRYTFEMSVIDSRGGRMKMMEAVYTRQK